MNSTLLVDKATSDDWTVQTPKNEVRRIFSRVRPRLGSFPTHLLRTGNPVLHSPSILPSGRAKSLNAGDADILHMHWVQGEMLSISEIGQLRKPVVWTLHDMWAFCGAEHYTEDYRWREGYRKNNRPSYESGFDLNRWTWQRKRKYWLRPIHIVTPSNWLAKCVRESVLMCDWPLSVIPNPIDTTLWQPVEQTLARDLLRLPKDIPLLLFGAIGGGQDPRKGFDLLKRALTHLRDDLPELELVVFGQSRPSSPPDLGFPIHYMGHIHDDLSLRVLYSCADALLVPSRQDNLPNTGVESLACGRPIIAFNTGGLSDMVKHKENGYLAEAFDVEDLAKGIHWVLSDQARLVKLGKRARTLAVKNFEAKSIASMYQQLFKTIIES
jgi:glycosyltransferase involved in cell wall biosynthesis